jgi:hypothetical protein
LLQAAVKDDGIILHDWHTLPSPREGIYLGIVGTLGIVGLSSSHQPVFITS